MEHSLTNIMKEFLLENQTVLILILMEHSLTVGHGSGESSSRSLNPYSNGTLSDFCRIVERSRKE